MHSLATILRKARGSPMAQSLSPVISRREEVLKETHKQSLMHVTVGTAAQRIHLRYVLSPPFVVFYIINLKYRLVQVPMS